MGPGGFPTGLPNSGMPLIGRDRELHEISELLARADVRLVTLTGTGGIGKTSLALAVKERLMTRYEDRVIFVPLDSIRDPDLVLPSVAQAFVPSESSLLSLRDSLAATLGDRPALFILDNFEQVLDARHDIAWLLSACPEINVLITSRAPIHISSEYEYEVIPLSTSDALILDPVEIGRNSAVQLFLRRTRRVLPQLELTESTAPAIAEICRRLDGVPLAIELAAARVKVLPPAAMLARLDKLIPLLTGGPADRPDRHQTLWKTIAWSIELLAPVQQQLFRRLSVFTGSFSLREAEVILGGESTGEAPLIDGIAGLVDNSLIRQIELEGEPRFQMLAMLRAFGLEQLANAGELETLRDRHADFFIDLAEAATDRLRGAERSPWLERLETAHDNLRAALTWLCERNDTSRAIRLAGALWQFWWWRSHLLEGRQRLEQVLALPGAADQGPHWARVLTGCGALAETAGNYEASAAYHDRAGAVWEDIDDQRGRATSYLFRWLVAFNADDQARMRELSQRSLDLYQQLGDEWGIAMSFMEQGVEAMRQNNPVEADRVLAAGIERFNKIDDAWGVAICQGVAGNVATDRRDFPTAAAMLNESLSTLLKRDDLWGVATVLPAVARLAAEQGDFEHAVRLSGAVQRMHEKMGAPLKVPFRERYQRNLAAARAKLGDERFKTILDQGRKLTPAEAVQAALKPIDTDSSGGQSTQAQKMLSQLSPREREVMRYIARGLSAKEIGEALFISVATVRTHSENIRNKFGLDNERALIAFIHENKLV